MLINTLLFIIMEVVRDTTVVAGNYGHDGRVS